MAKGDTSGTASKEEDENLWASVLAEVQTNRTSQLPSTKNLIVLGDKESGRTSLVNKLQGQEEPRKGAGLEYSYIDVRDEYREDHTRLGVWVLDGDQHHGNLLRFALTEANFADNTVLICVSMTTPWNIMDQLHSWATLLQDHIDKLGLNAEKTNELRKTIVRQWQSYIEPGDELENGPIGDSPDKRGAMNGPSGNATTGASATSPESPLKNQLTQLNDEDADIIPLPENCLTRNLGLNLVVVVTKTDYMADLEREFDYKDEGFDFIQSSVRKFCLQYGASLFYTSVKEDKNNDVLYKYLTHRIYGFPFRTPALVVEKDAVFIPSGWDNEKKIAILHENMHSVGPDKYYTDVIAKPMIRKIGASNRDLEVAAEDEQQFLLRQQQYLQQNAPTTSAAAAAVAGGLSPGMGLPAGVQKTGDRSGKVIVGSPGSALQGSPKKMDASGKPLPLGPGGVNSSEGVLASFFNSLLSKKTGQGGGPVGVAGGPASMGAGGVPGKLPGQGDDFLRSDAAAELDRLTRAQKSNNQVNNTDNSSSSLNNSSEC